ncbi:MAG: hypothetical protein AAF631_00340 [Pseudomonadota bacterium]
MGPGAAAPVHAIATFTLAAEAALEAAGPVLADLPNFTNVHPAVLTGAVTAS